ncbi:MAG: filamentous hemagglutinin N-terminal domain-containing protein [Nitrospina sp.]|jgi:trimeric autotransporter adhesin|nr:filamentous hemagglutinin N-terminal domain-containing protein [Nitrospina sp.]MBT3874721.1 filamentous hemagglutinin N-terminal domain-containing protein [Nitrospina sp.]MBT4049455.1 filamentous hemagglutinin N-terminal domain-containing protein [Nitrospina sp.]MBT4558389.1 filamentous hemagglutinin N-terminal domain-containing protein [Nitrospina sp.]MBT5348920.1 filamentous hemagglutinin N-terminal domain-containing protein [Nitrospina sp.]
MNVFKMNQIAFSQADGEPPKAGSTFPLGVARQVSKKPSNAAIFLVSFLTYLIGIFPSMVFALPTGGTVQAGSATIDSVSSQQIIIQQSTEKAIIDWQAFGIESTEHVDFQLSQGGVTLNRVTGNDPSNIFGKLTSNGDLWLINPNGVLFGSNAQVDVNGLIATTSNISNTDFLNGNYNFSVPSSLSSTVVNQGIITAAEGGLVALVAPGVQNMGIINARLGKVSLASGKTFTVDLYGDQLINLGVDSQVMGQVTGINGQALTSLVSNSGSIFADGGMVRLDVNAAQNIVDRVINMDGVIQARSVSEKNGQIILMGGDAGEVNVSGTLDASGYGQGETGGTVHVLGDMLDFSGNGLIDVSGDLGGGTLLFGGDYQGQGSVPNATDSYIGPDTQTYADAVTSGNGGKVIFWADRRMRFYGIVKGRGGQYFGDGGFVEVSGKEELYFHGLVDTTAPNGKTGTLLLDPDDITIGDAATSGAITATIYDTELEAISSTTNIELLATNSITLNDLGGDTLSLQQGSGNSVTFTVTNGTITFASSSDTISTNGGDIIFTATGALNLGSLASNGGDIFLTGDDLSLTGSASLASGTGRIIISHANSESTAGKIVLGDSSTTTCSTFCSMLISTSELAKMSGSELVIGGLRDDGSNSEDAQNSTATNGDIYVNALTTANTSGFTNGVQLNVNAHLSGSKGAIIFEGSASTFSALTANAVDGIEVNSDLTTTTGALSLDGDSDSTVDTLSGNDNILFASGTTLTSAGNITLSAASGGMVTAGDLTLSAPSSITMTGTMSGTGDISLSASNGITLNNGISTSSGSLNINANSSTLTLGSGATFSSTNALTLAASSTTSSGDLTLTSSASTISVNNALVSAGAVTMTASTGLTLSNSTLTGAGNISLQGGSSLSLASGMTITSSAGNITLGASGGTITANGALTLSSNGSITVSNTLNAAGAATLYANSGITLGNSFTANGAVTLDADLDNSGAGDFTISSGTLSTTNNALTLTANDLALTGSLNSGTGSTTINVSDGGSLGIGFSSGFGMNLTSTELGNIGGTGDLNLVNGAITFAAATSLSSSGLLTIGQSGGTITGQGDLTLSGAKGLSLSSGAILTAEAGAITLTAATVGISAAGAITLNATNGITINDDLTSAGTTTIDADTDNNGTGTFTLASGEALNTGNNALSITATSLTLSGTLSSGTAGTTLLTAQSGTTIGLGSGTGTFSLTDTELGQITAGSLTIGDGTNGNIAVDGVSSGNTDQFGALTLNATASGSSVTFGTSDSTFQGLTVNAENGIALTSSLTTNGTTSFNSDSDGDGTGDFSISAGKTLTTNNNALTITSNSMSFNSTGAITSGTAGTTLLTAQSGSTIGLGSGTGTFSLTDSELSQITAGSLTVGNTSNGIIIVEGVSSSSFGALTLNSASSVTFSTTASSFSSLTLDAGSGVGFGVGVTTTGNLSVTSGGAITNTGALTIGGTASFTTDVSDQAITLSNTSNSFTGAVSLNTSGTSGDATLTSNNAVTLSTSTVGGDLNVTVGGGNSLNATGAATAGGSISLLADDDIIFTASGDLTTTTGNITVTANNDSDSSGSGGALTMVDGTVFDAGTGTLALSADEDITLGLLQTTSSSDAAVTLTSTSGGAFDGDSDSSLDIDAADGRLVADLVTGFGTEFNAIETTVSSVDIDNATSGDINIFETDSLEVFKIDQAGSGDVDVSYQGSISGIDNAVVSFTGFPKGGLSFTRRDIKDQVLGNSGKTLGQLAFGTTQQLSFGTFELKAPDFQGKTPVDLVAGSSNGPFTMDIFSKSFELVELAEGTAGKFEGMEVSQSFWGGTKNTNLEVAKTPDKKSRARQRTAKRKKSREQKVGDTASISMKKPLHIQKSESGYLGFTP